MGFVFYYLFSFFCIASFQRFCFDLEIIDLTNLMNERVNYFIGYKKKKIIENDGGLNSSVEYESFNEKD